MAPPVLREIETNNVIPYVTVVESECCSNASYASNVTDVQSRSDQNMPDIEAVNVNCGHVRCSNMMEMTTTSFL